MKSKDEMPREISDVFLELEEQNPKAYSLAFHEGEKCVVWVKRIDMIT